MDAWWEGWRCCGSGREVPVSRQGLHESRQGGQTSRQGGQTSRQGVHMRHSAFIGLAFGLAGLGYVRVTLRRGHSYTEILDRKSVV